MNPEQNTPPSPTHTVSKGLASIWSIYSFFLECQCFGKADSCTYDATVEAEKRSLNINNAYEGGGVCQGCRDNTAGKTTF